MSNPSFSNIDQWLFELHEGNLSPEQVAQLESFVIQHPEIDVDLDMWKLSYIDSTPLVYPHQDKLIKRRPVFFYWSTGVAAIFAIIFGIAYFNNNDSTETSLLTTNISKHSNTEEINHLKTNLSDDINPIENLTSNVETNQKIVQQTHVSKNENTHIYTPIKVNNNTLNYSDNQKFNNENSSTKMEYVESLNNNPSFNNYHTATYSKMNSLTMKRSFFTDTYQSSLAFDANSEEKVIENWTLHRKSAKHKSQTFSYKLNDFKRSIQKMADNPIALKNLKDPHYHIPGMQAVDINFGAVGTLLATRVQTTSRYQWMGQTNDQLTNNLLIDGYVYAIRGGIGLQVNQSTYHNNGYQNTFAAITYSPKFSVTKNVTIEPAIRFKMGNQRINPSKLPIGQLVEFDRGNAQQFYSENEAPIGKAMWYKDLGLSVMVNTKWFYVGTQFDNLGRHQSNIYGSEGKQRAGVHSVFTLGTDYESKNKKLGFSPYFVYQNYEQLSEAWLGANFRASWFTMGAAVSSNVEPAASIGVKFKHFALTYNADYTKSMMTAKSALSHQITLRFLTNPSRVGQRLLNY